MNQNNLTIKNAYIKHGLRLVTTQDLLLQTLHTLKEILNSASAETIENLMTRQRSLSALVTQGLNWQQQIKKQLTVLEDDCLTITTQISNLTEKIAQVANQLSHLFAEKAKTFKQLLENPAPYRPNRSHPVTEAQFIDIAC